MTKAYQIYVVDTGEVIGVQTWDDIQAPVVAAGQAARPIPFHVVAEGVFSATGAGEAVVMVGAFNITLWGTFSATIAFERSFDAGTTWIPVAFPDGTPITYTAPGSGSWGEIEAGVYYRLRCSSYTSGAASWRISR